jgi:hypothetical protein
VITQDLNGRQDIGHVNFGNMKDWIEEIDIYGDLFTEKDVCYNGNKNCKINITEDYVSFKIETDIIYDNIDEAYFLRILMEDRNFEADIGWMDFTLFEEYLYEYLNGDTIRKFEKLVNYLGIEPLDETNIVTIFEDYVGEYSDFIPKRWANLVDDRLIPTMEKGIEEYRWYWLKYRWDYDVKSGSAFLFQLDFNKEDDCFYLSINLDDFNNIFNESNIKNYTQFIKEYVIEEINRYDLNGRFNSDWGITEGRRVVLDDIVNEFIRECYTYIKPQK